jgi:hypothetical protein
MTSEPSQEATGTEWETLLTVHNRLHFLQSFPAQCRRAPRRCGERRPSRPPRGDAPPP